MLSLVQFLVAWVVMSNMAAGITYTVQELCEPDSPDHPFFHRHRRHIPLRIYGKSLEITMNEPIVVTAGTIPPIYLVSPIESKRTFGMKHSVIARNASSVDSDASVPNVKDIRKPTLDTGPNSNYEIDCRFTIRPRIIGSNVTLVMEWWNMEENCTNFVQIIHGPDMFLIRMAKLGSQAVSNAIFFPLHVRMVMCRRSTTKSGLIILATSKGDGFGDYTTPTLIAFLTPCGILLLLLTSFFLGCCCCTGTTCRKRREQQQQQQQHSTDNSSSTLTTPASTPLNSHRSEDHQYPPTYDDLFPTSISIEALKGKETPPPTYDKLRLEGSDNSSSVT